MRNPKNSKEATDYVTAAIAYSLDQPGMDVIKIIQDFSEPHTVQEIRNLAESLLLDSISQSCSCLEVAMKLIPADNVWWIEPVTGSR
jgi:hypothetical protein